MDRLMHYDRTVQELVEQCAAEWKPHDGTTIEAVTDVAHGHYQIVRSGWKDGRFVHSCLVHITVDGQTVRLLRNDTDVEWDRELIDRGIAPEDIILAFRQPVGLRDAHPANDSVASQPATPILKS